jgi:hypothetical protein
MITAITSMRTSPLRMWVNSWPSTDSISASLSALMRPEVTVIVLLVVHSRGEGVEAVILDHLELRRGDAARDAQVLEQIVEPRLLLPRHLAPAGHRVDHALMEFVGDEDPQRRAERRPGRGVERIAQRAAQQHVGRRVDGERLAHERAGIDQEIDEEEQADEQRDRSPLVRLDVGVESVGGH